MSYHGSIPRLSLIWQIVLDITNGFDVLDMTAQICPILDVDCSVQAFSFAVLFLPTFPHNHSGQRLHW